MTVEQIRSFFQREKWVQEIFHLDASKYPVWQGRLISTMQGLLSSWLRFRESRSDIQVGALSYITFLSLVPILAFSFSIIKTMGLHKQLQDDVITPILDQWVDPVKAPELREGIEQMLLFVEGTDFASLGAIGFLTLGYAVIRLLGSAEQAMNALWGVRKSRAFMRKIADYISVAIIVPVVLIFAGTTSHWLDSIQAFMGVWSAIGLRILVLFVLWTGFGLLYYLLPNTRVQLSAALRGGVLGGTVWTIIHQTLLTLQVGVASYNAIYAGFSVLPLFMLWIYGGWWAIIIGASYAAGHQMSEHHRRNFLGKSLDLRGQERLATRIMVMLGHQYSRPVTSIDLEELKDVLNEEMVVVELVLSKLEEANLVVQTKQNHVVLARSVTEVHLFTILDALKGQSDEDVDNPWSKMLDEAPENTRVDSVESILEDFQMAVQQHPSNHNLQTLCSMLEDSTEWESSVLKLSPSGTDGD
jgi:membrane protein